MYFQQHVNSLPISNSVANIAIKADDGTLFSISTPSLTTVRHGMNSFTNQHPRLSKLDAVRIATRALGHLEENQSFTYNESESKVIGASFTLLPIPVKLEYFITTEGALELVYNLNIREDMRW
jgi:hypothetical protein